MSGISGMVNSLGNIEHSDISAMKIAMAHYGVDGISEWRDRGCELVYYERKVTPESCFDEMPRISHCNKYVVLADVRLDNRDELLSKLVYEKSERVISDAELIILAYEKWEDRCFDKLLGDFALALWDRAKSTLFLAVDPMGTRNLYYYTTNHKCTFASNITAIVKTNGVPKILDEESFILQASGLRKLVPESTCFSGIKNVAAGQVIKISSCHDRVLRAQKRYYYHLAPVENHLKNEDELIERFSEILERAVADRMRSSFPISMLLSGGLDSSAIVSYAANKENRSSTPPYFCISSCLEENEENWHKDERYYVNIVKNHCNLPIDYVVENRSPLQVLEHAASSYESPIFSNPNLYGSLFSQARKKGSRIVLDGLGGEWGPSYPGFGYYFALYKALRWKKLWRNVLLQSRIEESNFYSTLFREVLAPFIVKPILPKFSSNSLQSRNAFKLDYQFKYDILARAEDGFGSDPRTQRSMVNRFKMAQFGRTPKQHNSAHYGISIATPYIDKRVVEFCLGLPDALFNKSGWQRYLIRAATKGVMAEGIRWRKDKKPFSPNYFHLMQTEKLAYHQYILRLEQSELATQYLDIGFMKSTMEQLFQCSSWQTSHQKRSVRRIIDRGTSIGAFLLWFEKL